MIIELSRKKPNDSAQPTSFKNTQRKVIPFTPCYWPTDRIELTDPVASIRLDDVDRLVRIADAMSSITDCPFRTLVADKSEGTIYSCWLIPRGGSGCPNNNVTAYTDNVLK